MYDEPMNDNVANGLVTIANAFCFAENSDILTLDGLFMAVSFVIWRRAVYLLDVHKLSGDKNISYTALGLIVVTAHAWYRIVLLSL